MDNLDSKIAQVTKDIKLLEDEKKKLEAERIQKEQYVFQAGDVAVNAYGNKRVMVNINGRVVAFSLTGGRQGGGKSQEYFAEQNYKKVSTLKDLLL